MDVRTLLVEDNKEIRAIGNETIHKICSGQVGIEWYYFECYVIIGYFYLGYS